MKVDRLLNYSKRLLLAAIALGVGLWATLSSLGATFKTIRLLGWLGAEGFTLEDRHVLLPGPALGLVLFLALGFTVLVPILALGLPAAYFNRYKWILARIVLLFAVLALDCSVLVAWFAPYEIHPDIEPIPHAFEEIRAGFGLVERVVYGELLDQAERGASEWVVVVHAVIVTAILLLAIEGLRWVARRLRAGKAHEPDGGELTSSS